MEQRNQEMQLLSCSAPPPASSSFEIQASDHHHPTSLDLQLSISMKPASDPGVIREVVSVDALKWQAAEQIRLAAMEKAYAERVRELSRREMEVAQSEFARARALWERARDEVQRAERMKERAIQKVDSACMEMEITCYSCSHKFRP